VIIAPRHESSAYAQYEQKVWRQVLRFRDEMMHGRRDACRARVDRASDLPRQEAQNSNFQLM